MMREPGCGLDIIILYLIVYLYTCIPIYLYIANICNVTKEHVNNTTHPSIKAITTQQANHYVIDF